MNVISEKCQSSKWFIIVYLHFVVVGSYWLFNIKKWHVYDGIWDKSCKRPTWILTKYYKNENSISESVRCSSNNKEKNVHVENRVLVM